MTRRPPLPAPAPPAPLTPAALEAEAADARAIEPHEIAILRARAERFLLQGASPREARTLAIQEELAFRRAFCAPPAAP